MSTNESTVSPYVISEPVCSSDSIWYKEDMNTSITSIIDNKAELDHEHSGYAAEGHTHSGYATEDHTHDYAASTHGHAIGDITNLATLLLTALSGDVKENLTSVDVLATVAAKPTGLYSFYAGVGATGNPRATNAWRYVVHKTDVNYGWMVAFGSDGSVMCNYLHEGNWRGYRTLYDATPKVLWSGTKVMVADDTVTPTKKLSECRTGWVLLWSDNNPGEGAQNLDYITTVIPNIMQDNEDWTGRNWLCPVGRYANTTAEAVTTKIVCVYDDKITGHANNDQISRDDIVLRAVIEF